MKKFSDKLRYLVALGCGLPAFAFAEGSTLVDTSAVNTNLTQLKTDLTGWVTSALPIVLGIAGAFLLFWLIKFAIRVVKQFAAKGA